VAQLERAHEQFQLDVLDLGPRHQRCSHTRIIDSSLSMSSGLDR
jgi:hypothetical protein